MTSKKIVMISDTHTLHDKIQIPECDILIHAGDWTYKGEKSEVEEFARWLNKQPAKHKVIIPGNHEVQFEKSLPNSRNWLLDLAPDVNLLIHESIEIEGIKFFGSPWTPYFFNWAFNGARNPVEAAHTFKPLLKPMWEEIPEDTNILVTHGPPFDILDKTRKGDLTGCVDLRNKIESLSNLKYHVFGHIHEAYGIINQDRKTFVNASICDFKYRPLNKPLEFNYE